jgi:hypothetical protein
MRLREATLGEKNIPSLGSLLGNVSMRMSFNNALETYLDRSLGSVGRRFEFAGSTMSLRHEHGYTAEMHWHDGVDEVVLALAVWVGDDVLFFKPELVGSVTLVGLEIAELEVRAGSDLFADAEPVMRGEELEDTEIDDLWVLVVGDEARDDVERVMLEDVALRDDETLVAETLAAETVDWVVAVVFWGGAAGVVLGFDLGAFGSLWVTATDGEIKDMIKSVITTSVNVNERMAMAVSVVN